MKLNNYRGYQVIAPFRFILTISLSVSGETGDLPPYPADSFQITLIIEDDDGAFHRPKSDQVLTKVKPPISGSP